MKCKQARRELALWVGGDHDPRLQPLLQAHLSECPECRAFSRQMKDSLHPLRSMAQIQEASASMEQGSWSLWPAVRARLQRRRIQFNDLLDTPVGWLPVTGLSAACIALFALVFSTSNVIPQNQSGIAFDAPVSGTTVEYPFDRTRLLQNASPFDSRMPIQGFNRSPRGFSSEIPAAGNRQSETHSELLLRLLNSR